MLKIKVALWIEGCKRVFHDRWPDGLKNESGQVVETVVIVAAGAAMAILAMAAIAAAVEVKVGSIQL